MTSPMLGILAFVLIVGVGILFRTGYHTKLGEKISKINSPSTVGEDHGHKKGFGIDNVLWKLYMLTWAVLFIFIGWNVATLSFYGGKVLKRKSEEVTTGLHRTTAATARGTPQASKVPPVIYGTTPDSRTFDYAFNIESDAPILITPPGQAAILYKSKCQVLPQIQNAGPKLLTDPNDPVNGHIPYRVYAVGPEDQRPCPK